MGCQSPVTYEAPCLAKERAALCPWSNMVQMPDSPPPNAPLLHWKAIHSGMSPAPGAADAHFSDNQGLACDACLVTDSPSAAFGTIWVFYDAPNTEDAYCPKASTPIPMVSCPGGCMKVW
jgi:hypothetical protein